MEMVWCSCRRRNDVKEKFMAQPIPLEIPPRNPRAELRARLEQAPEEHAEAVLAAYELLQELHNRGVLEITRGALAASDEILERVVDNVKTPEAIRAIRNLLFWRQILGSIEPEWFKGIFQAVPEGIAQATAERDMPVSFFGLLRRLASKDSLRALAAAIDFLQAFGRHLHEAENPLPRN
jgi:uncharacterized protein YjgD (DUF1641 family)